MTRTIHTACCDTRKAISGAILAPFTTRRRTGIGRTAERGSGSWAAPQPALPRLHTRRPNRPSQLYVLIFSQTFETGSSGHDQTALLRPFASGATETPKTTLSSRGAAFKRSRRRWNGAGIEPPSCATRGQLTASHISYHACQEVRQETRPKTPSARPLASESICADAMARHPATA